MPIPSQTNRHARPPSADDAENFGRASSKRHARYNFLANKMMRQESPSPSSKRHGRRKLM
jgi:hypothetical protein